MKILRLSFALLLSLLFVSAFAETLAPQSAQTIQALYTPRGSSIAGNPNGKVVLVEFFDYNCAYCRALQPTVQRLIQKNPDLKVVYKEILLYDESLPATAAAFAATKQGQYLAMHRALLTARNPLTPIEVVKIAKRNGLNVAKLTADMATSQARTITNDNLALVRKLRIEGTPAFVIGTSTRPLYLFEGSERAEAALQSYINQAKRQ
ncbi:MAG: DsbA family protein [Gammaproteobacteria bacterium]